MHAKHDIVTVKSFRMSVCSMPTLCLNEWTYRHKFLTVRTFPLTCTKETVKQCSLSLTNSCLSPLCIYIINIGEYVKNAYRFKSFQGYRLSRTTLRNVARNIRLVWFGGRVVTVFDLRSKGRGFKSRPPRSRVQPWASCSHIYASVTKQY